MAGVVKMEMNENKRSKNRTRKKLISCCTLTIVLLFVFSSPLSTVPLLSLVPTGTATFSSITITDVTPTEFTPGDTSGVIVTVKNNGGRDAKDIRLTFQGTEVLSLVGPTVLHLSSLNAWSEKDVAVTLHVKEEAPNGIYHIPVNVSWREYYLAPSEGYVTGPEQTARLGLSFNVIGEGVLNVGDVTTDPTDIRPGDENVEIRAVIENSGEAAAKDIEANLLFTTTEFKSSWSGTERSYLGRLNSGEKSEAVFHVDFPDTLESGQHSIPLQITYKDTKGAEFEVMREVTILVKPKPDFEIVSYFTEPESLSAADTGVLLHVQIQNIGSERAESASVRITGEADVPFDYEVKSDFVGNLEIGAEGEAILEFDVDEDALPKVYSMGVEIRCTGDRDLGDDNVYIFTKEVKVEVSSSSAQEGFPLPGFEALLSLFALLVAFGIVGRRRGV
jgi:hypothetical protein